MISGYVLFLVLYFSFIEVECTYPKIHSVSKDIILNPGNDYNLTCSGNEPLKWSYPKTNAAEESLTGIFIYEIKSSQSPRYRSILSIINISYQFVGYYKCLYDDSTKQDAIYLYVNDSLHLSVQDRDYYQHYAVQYKPSLIQLCRPTAPDINVTIGTRGMKKNLGFYVTSFDPHKGLWINGTINTILNGKEYLCLFKRGNFTQLRRFFMVVERPRNSIAKPFIEDLSQNHTETGQNFTLNCYLQEESRNIDFLWKTPRGNFQANSIRKTIKDKLFLVSTLNIHNVNTSDSGKYECHVSDMQDHENSYISYVKIHDRNTCFINIDQENYQQRNKTVNAGENVEWKLNFIAHPEPQMIWVFEKRILEDGRKYSIKNRTKNTFTFLINNVSLKDDGLYNVKGKSSRENGLCSEELIIDLKLTVKDKPNVILEPQEVFLTYNETKKEIKCTAMGNPLPEIQWKYENCLNKNKCHISKDEIITKITGKYEKFSTFYLSDTENVDGSVKCIANNSFGTTSATLQYYISEIENGFAVFNYGDQAIIEKVENKLTSITLAEDYKLTFTCAVSLNKSNELRVKYNNTDIENFKTYRMENVNNGRTLKSIISLAETKTKHSGIYTCEIKNKKTGNVEYENVTFYIREEQRPKILATNLDRKIQIDYPNMAYLLYCNYSGIPKVDVKWYKDHKLMHSSNRIIIEQNGARLNFTKTKISDEGTYGCTVSNKLGSDHRSAVLEFKVKPVSILAYVIITVLIGLLLIAALIYIIINKRKEGARKRELKALGLENFHNGNPENLDPDKGIDDQAELLPYNKKWEFPIEQLKLGKQLGSGAFGVVVKAEARKLINGQETTIVAVKMVKKNADHSYIKALVSELKILIHLGQHINVVNLLGACTKNVTKKELLMIVEFCQYGNLQHYLLRNRSSFINQIDPKSGKIDFSIGNGNLARFPSISTEQCKSKNKSMQDYRTNPNSSTPLMTNSDANNDSMILNSNNSNQQLQPQWRTNYHGDYKGVTINPVSTKDLISWSFQIARGMEYLVSRKVLHGDLAARNVLLADNNIVKICDFGLAKTMFNDNNYQKKTNCPLPLKWMAIESIKKKIFSTYSDVWAFGIVLWELFSLGHTPYPGIEADERLYNKLINGYRMEAPKYAPKQIYSLMMDCWATKPEARPSFTNLAEKIGYLLEESVRKHYIEINDPYLAINTEKFVENDYLAMLSPPSFDIILPPPHSHYQNEEILTAGVSSSDSNYTLMEKNGNGIDLQEIANVFDFNLKKDKNAVVETKFNGSDRDGGYLCPLLPLSNSISNPNYHNLSEGMDINNYVTMPKYRYDEQHQQQPLKSYNNQKAIISHYINGNVFNEIKN